MSKHGELQHVNECHGGESGRVGDIYSHKELHERGKHLDARVRALGIDFDFYIHGKDPVPHQHKEL
jgi:hypothetical protein